MTDEFRTLAGAHLVELDKFSALRENLVVWRNISAKSKILVPRAKFSATWYMLVLLGNFSVEKEF